MKQPQHRSAEPGVFLDFFSQLSPPTQFLSTEWVILLASPQDQANLGDSLCLLGMSQQLQGLSG